jgi:hypothetical protein
LLSEHKKITMCFKCLFLLTKSDHAKHGLITSCRTYNSKCKYHFFFLVIDWVGLIVVPLDLVLSAIWEGWAGDLAGLFAATLWTLFGPGLGSKLFKVSWNMG